MLNLKTALMVIPSKMTGTVARREIGRKPGSRPTMVSPMEMDSAAYMGSRIPHSAVYFVST